MLRTSTSMLSQMLYNITVLLELLLAPRASVKLWFIWDHQLLATGLKWLRMAYIRVSICLFSTDDLVN